MATPQFTYLIGAGASANTIPVVKELPGYMHNVLVWMQNKWLLTEERFPDWTRISGTKLYVQKLFLQDLTWLINETVSHASIDTLAKKLYLRNDRRSLKKLKAVLSTLFKVCQSSNGVDTRYDAFFATLLTKTDNFMTLPANVKILSWNYDYQVELSVSSFHGTGDVELIESYIDLIPRKGWPNPGPSRFSLIKLNGTVGVYYEGGKKTYGRDELELHKYNHKLSENEMLVHVEKAIMEYHWAVHPQSAVSGIHYSWEDDVIAKDTRQRALEATKNTESLIVIGYSFPTFNRVLDGAILGNMKNLKRVYIQSPKETASSVKARFQALRPSPEPELITEIDEFFIPFEFTSPS